MTRGVSVGGMRWLRRLAGTIHVHLIQPFLETHDLLSRVAWGAAIGMFVGMTPTVGVQMYAVTLIWALCRYLLGFRFNLTIAVAMVWVSNPVTMLPLYYLFLKTGDGMQAMLGYEVKAMTFALFKAEVYQLGGGAPVSWLQWLAYAGQVFLVEFGWPIVLGSLIYAIPLSIATYPVTRVTLGRYRRYLAQAQGLSYEAWRARYEAKR